MMDRRDFLLASLGAAAMATARGAVGQQPMAQFAKAWRSAPDEGFARRPLALVAGKAPSDLNGTYFLNGPAKHDRNGFRNEHWFDGDGMLHAFRFGGGDVTHEGRFVETAKFQAERSAGRFLYPGFDTMPPDPAPVTGPDVVNAANTSVVQRGTEIWALWEGGSPTALKPNDLSTIGPVVLDEALAGVPFSAHPRRDRSGTLWGFGYEAFSGAIILSEIAPDGALRRFKVLRDLPRAMVHDFLTTERHIIIGFPPFWLVRRGNLAFLDRFRWHPDEPRLYVVIDKQDFEIRRRYETPARFQFHHFGGYEERDGTIRFAACSYRDARWMLTEGRDVMTGEPFTGTREAHFETVVLHPDGRAVFETDGEAAEFPVSDPRQVDQPATQWSVGRSRPGNRLTNSLVARAPDGVVAGRWDADAAIMLSEHIVVPRDGGGAYLLGTQFDTTRGVTFLAVFDAHDLMRGPRAVWRLPQVIPAPLHGTWVAA